jgi:hypothetical protein
VNTEQPCGDVRAMTIAEREPATVEWVLEMGGATLSLGQWVRWSLQRSRARFIQMPEPARPSPG